MSAGRAPKGSGATVRPPEGVRRAWSPRAVHPTVSRCSGSGRVHPTTSCRPGHATGEVAP